MLFVSILTWFSCLLYLRTRSLVGDSFQSYYELGYMLFGKKTIYFIAFNFAFMGWSLLVIYYIIFGDICAIILENILSKHKWPYILTIGILLLPELLRKELRNTKISSKFNLLGILVFILLLGGELVFHGIPPDTK